MPACLTQYKMSHGMRFPTMWYMRPAKPQISLDQSLCQLLEYSMIVKLLTEHHLEFLSLKGGCRGSSESTHVKMSHCWKSHAQAQMVLDKCSCPWGTNNIQNHIRGLQWLSGRLLDLGSKGSRLNRITVLCL